MKCNDTITTICFLNWIVYFGLQRKNPEVACCNISEYISLHLHCTLLKFKVHVNKEQTRKYFTSPYFDLFSSWELWVKTHSIVCIIELKKIASTRWHKMPANVANTMFEIFMYNEGKIIAETRDFQQQENNKLERWVWIQPFTLYKATTLLINRQFVRHIASSINSPNNESELNNFFLYIHFFLLISAFLSSSALKVENLNWQTAKRQQWENNIRDERDDFGRSFTTIIHRSTSRFFFFYCWVESN